VNDEGARVELIDGLQEARLIGEFDLDVYEKVCAELGPLFEATGDVTLDLSGVGFLDSSAIRLFVRLQQSRTGEGTLVLRAPQPHVARVLTVAGIAELGIRVEGASD
jgi:anti-anti-sigma factor